MSPYQYGSLDPDKSEIRLLQVSPAKQWTDPLTCALIHRPLGLKQVLPHYSAVSYCWENQIPTEIIRIGRQTLSISKTVDCFLRWRRQNSSSAFYLWIDAICIDQVDEDEKAKQVGLMRQTYSDADELLIRLGESSNDSDMAIGLMDNLGRAPNLRPWTMKDQEIAALMSLLERPWWFRMWIVQEVVFGALSTRDRPMQIICGGQTVDYSIFMAGARRLKRHSEEYTQPFHFVNAAVELDDARAREEEASLGDEQATRGSLLRLLAETRNRLASDARDKVYGILGMVSPKDELIRHVKADYTKTVISLYTELATQALEVLPRCQILRYCGRQELRGLPSWVPDWSTASQEHHLWNEFDAEDDDSSEIDMVEELTERAIIIREIPKDRKHYTALDHVLPSMALSDVGRELHLAGIVWDSVATTSEPFVDDVKEPWENAMRFMLQVASCKMLIESLLVLPNPYRDSDHRVVAFWRALMADHVGDGSYRPLVGYAKWLPPLPTDWIARPPHISETRSGLLWRIRCGALLGREEMRKF